MNGWIERRLHRAFISFLQNLHDYADGRISKGDMDFDDVLYRMRDATATLLEILPKQIR